MPSVEEIRLILNQHVVRGPCPDLASMKKLSKVREWNWSALKTIANIVESVQVGVANSKILGENRCYLLHFEHFMSMPEVVMRNVAEFFGISFDDAMLTPTINGLPVKVNSVYKARQVIGRINAKASQEWRQEMNPMELCIAVIAFLFITRRLNKHCAST